MLRVRVAEEVVMGDLPPVCPGVVKHQDVAGAYLRDHDVAGQDVLRGAELTDHCHGLVVDLWTRAGQWPPLDRDDGERVAVLPGRG